MSEINLTTKYDEVFQKMETEDYLLPENEIAARTVTIEAMNEFHRQNPTMTIALLTKGKNNKGFVMAEDMGTSVQLHPLNLVDMKMFGFFAGLHQPEGAEIDTRERLNDIFDDIVRCHPAGVPVYDMDVIEEKRRDAESRHLLSFISGVCIFIGCLIMAALVSGGQSKEVHVTA